MVNKKDRRNSRRTTPRIIKSKMNKILITIFFMFLLVAPLISAMDWDNKKTFTLDENTSKYGKIEIYNSIFMGIGKGKKLVDAELLNNTDECGNYCSAEKEINMYEEGVLIEDITFYTIRGNSEKKQDIYSYEIYILSNGRKIKYEIGDKVKEGKYYVILEGKKKATRTVDWKIKINGKWTDEWAIWRSIGSVTSSVYDDFEDEVVNYSKWYYGSGSQGNMSESDGFLHANTVSGEADKRIISNSTFYELGYNITLRINLTSHPSVGVNCIWFLNETGYKPVGQVSGNGGGCLSGSQSEGFEGNYTFYKYNNTAIGVVTPTDSQILSMGENVDNLKIGTFSNWAGESEFDISFVNYGLSSITLNSPENSFFSNNTNIQFNCSLSQSGATIVNGSLLLNTTNDLNIVNTSTGLSGNYQKINLSHTFSNEGHYLWTCQGCDSDGDCGIGVNRTITIDSTSPQINITSPSELEDYGYIGKNTSLNWTIDDLSIQSCWFNYNGTNYTLDCSGGNTTFLLEQGNTNLTFYANDTIGNMNETLYNWTYKVWENSRNFSNLTYETDTQSYSINVTSNSSLTSVALSYDGTDYSTTQSGDTYTGTVTHSADNNGTKFFGFNFTYAGTVIPSYVSNNTVNNTELNICNVTSDVLNTTFLNLTFQDEETLTRIGGQIDTSTFTYYLGDGSVNQILIYSNLTNLSEYNFCFTPAHRTFYNTREIQYSATGYPQRKYDDDTSLTNTTTHKTLYLLSSSDGIYSSLQVLDGNGDTVDGVSVTIERPFSGVWTVVGKETTDGSGLVTFWINPDYDHRYTLEKSGCTTTSETVRPTQTTYTTTMDCTGASGDIYVSNIEGIKYFILPLSGLISTGQTNFSFELYSSKGNIVGSKFEIVNLSNYVLTSVSSACASSRCTISTLYNVTFLGNIKGRYYVNTGNGYILLDADAHWMNVNITEQDGTFKQFWLDLSRLFDDWHEEGEDTTNTSDFNRIVFIFLFLAIGLSVFNKLTGFDSSNPGSFMIFLTVVVLLGSIAGHTDLNGFFYLDNFGRSRFINNYIVFFFVGLNTIATFVVTKMRSMS